MPAPTMPLSAAANAVLKQAIRQTEEEFDVVDAKLGQRQDDLKKLRKAGVSAATLASTQKDIKMLQEQKKVLGRSGLSQNIDAINEKTQSNLVTRFFQASQKLIKVLPSAPNATTEDGLRVLAKLSGATEEKQNKAGSTFKNIPYAHKDLAAALKHTEQLQVTQKVVEKLEQVIDALVQSGAKAAPAQQASSDYPMGEERAKYATQLYKSVKQNLLNLTTDIDPLNDMGLVALYFGDAADLAKLASLILEGSPSKISKLYNGLDTAASEFLSSKATDFVEEIMYDKTKYAPIASQRKPKR